MEVLTKSQFCFTFHNLKKNFEEALNNGYQIIGCIDYVDYKKNKQANKILVNRIDVDVSCEKAMRLARIFNDLKIKATFFIRLHAKEYNPFAPDNYKYLKYIRDSGHEIGYHSEVVDMSVIWDEPAYSCLVRDIEVINKIFNIQIKGVASHRSVITGLNNLDFWSDKKPFDFKLIYEAYDTQPEFNLFQKSFFISDSNWTYWKCYNKGRLMEEDKRSLGEHAADGHRIIYSLIHPETYYNEHPYE